jgi:hypothetical protein
MAGISPVCAAGWRLLLHLARGARVAPCSEVHRGCVVRVSQRSLLLLLYACVHVPMARSTYGQQHCTPAPGRRSPLLLLLVAASSAAARDAVGPPDWFDACASDQATVVAQHCCNSTHRSGCNLRVMRKPNGTDPKDMHAARFPVDRPWALQYEYKVPRKPSGPDWDASNEIYFIWGDTDFDSYGLAPRAEFPMSKYIYNQIVPQLVLGNALATGGPASNFAPGWIVFNDWAVQAQYYWSSCSKADGRRCARGHSQSFAFCGPAVNVSADDTIETVISYDPESGAITGVRCYGFCPNLITIPTRPMIDWDMYCLSRNLWLAKLW